MNRGMEFRGTEAECAEVIADVDAERGYPRTYTQADVESGAIKVRGRIRAEDVATTTVAHIRPVDPDEFGEPTSARRWARISNPSATERIAVGRRKMRKLLRRGNGADLRRIDGIGAVQADQIIAAQVTFPRLQIPDLVGIIPQRAIDALIAHRVLLRDVDEDDTVAADVPNGA